MDDRPRLTPEDTDLAHRTDHRYLLRIPVFLVIWGLGTAAAVFGIQLGGLGWALVPLGILAAAGALHGVSLFSHEGVHGVLFRNRWANDALAAVCAWPVLQNFSAYRVLHLRHHASLGDEGDPDHYANYTRWTWGVFLMNWGRLILGYPAYLLLIPVLGFQRGTARDRLGIVAELLGAAVLLGSIVLLLPWTVFLVGWLLPMVVINTLVNIRGMSQHTLLPEPTHPVRGSRTFLVNPVVQFFMCNENFHLEHHLYPGVPWYHLPFVHARLHADLERQGAPFTPGYLRFVTTFVTESVRRGPFG